MKHINSLVFHIEAPNRSTWKRIYYLTICKLPKTSWSTRLSGVSTKYTYIFIATVQFQSHKMNFKFISKSEKKIPSLYTVGGHLLGSKSP